MGPNLTAAEGFILGVGAKMFSCCGARCAPCRRRGCVAHRPRPLAQVASSATGGAPIAPHRRPSDRLWSCGFGDLWFYLLVDASDLEKINFIKVTAAEKSTHLCRHSIILLFAVVSFVAN